MSDLYDTLGKTLYQALRQQQAIEPLTHDYPELSLNEAYAISQAFLARRLQDGETIIGKKIGVTSKPVMDMLGIHQPDFGFITDKMWAKDGRINCTTLIAPRAEAEIAFRLKSDLHGPSLNEADILSATGAVAACFEIVDSRIQDWQIKIQDTIADNASCGMMVIGHDWVDPQHIDLLNCTARVYKNGVFLSQGIGAATLGSPLTALAWLANTLGERNVALKAGEIVLSGSLVALEPVKSGDVMRTEIESIGVCEVEFYDENT